MLQLEDLDVFYGLSHVLFGVSLQVKHSELVCLVGRNGAGKSTTLKTIMGSLTPERGSIRFDGKEITGRSSYSIARLGIGYVPQGGRIFADLTVRENLNAVSRGPDALESVYDLFPILRDRSKGRAEHLSGGERQMLSIGRVLMSNPRLMLLDEPCMGLAPVVANHLLKQIERFRGPGISILLVEQSLTSGVDASDRCYVIERGMICFESSGQRLERDKKTIRACLGV